MPLALLERGPFYGGDPAPHYIGPVLISPTRKSDAWTAEIAAYLAGASISIPYLKSHFMSPGDALIPLTPGDSKMYVKGA